MQFSLIRALLGLLLLIFSITMLVPIVIALIYREDTINVFLLAFAITAATGGLLWLPNRNPDNQMQARDGFLVTALFWIVLSVFGALPLLFADSLDLSITDAIFESVSGLTTTGATVVTGLDTLPKSILYYRQQLQWLGGIGIIVIAIAILPMLGIGGMQLYRAETPGPMKDNKLTPRITSTAKVLFSIYVIMTILCGFAYWLAGMSAFDALAHSYSTVAIGGFSTHDASMGHFDNPAVLAVGIVFMLLAGINFGLHYFAFKEKSILAYLRDAELKFYLGMIAFTSIAICTLLAWAEYRASGSTFFVSIPEQIIHGVFQVVSIATTTGFASTDYGLWPIALPVAMFLLAFIGASAGSTGGGMKAIRILLIIKQGYRELLRLIHPNAVIPIKLGNRPVSDRVVDAVWSFFAIYLVTFFVLVILVLMTGVDFETGFSAVGASINNLGPGLGDVLYNYSNIADSTKWILCLAMLMGRLEVFTLLVLFTPAFWRR